MAVRGCEKRIYHIKNTESEIFDEAYFILKVGGKKSFVGPRELEKEALRLVNGAEKPSDLNSQVRRGAAKREKLKAFFFGSLFSFGAVGLFWEIICFIL